MDDIFEYVRFVLNQNFQTADKVIFTALALMSKGELKSGVKAHYLCKMVEALPESSLLLFTKELKHCIDAGNVPDCSALCEMMHTNLSQMVPNTNLVWRNQK
jgi:hypothetical protein